MIKYISKTPINVVANQCEQQYKSRAMVKKDTEFLKEKTIILKIKELD